MTAPYLVALLDPDPASERSRAFAERLHAAARRLGLGDGELATCAAAEFTDDTNRAIAAVYFGGPGRCDPLCADVAALFVKRGYFILPVVPGLDDYPDQVPSALRGVNGVRTAETDRAVNAVLVALGLLRRQRRVFISYRRAESTHAARQLHRALVEAGYEAFLDTASVDKGRIVQRQLWERMLDTELVVLLDTRGALESPWVADEIARANTLGIEVFRVVWPDEAHQQRRKKGASYSDNANHQYLSADDFWPSAPHDSSRGGKMRAATVRRLRRSIDRARARAWRLRRTAVTETFQRRVSRRVGGVTVRIDGTMRLERREGRPAWVVPVIGIPRSPAFHGAAIRYLEGDAAEAATSPDTEVCVLYQSEGLQPEQRQHLGWLRRFLPVRPLDIEEVETWLKAG